MCIVVHKKISFVSIFSKTIFVIILWYTLPFKSEGINQIVNIYRVNMDKKNDC